MTMPKTRHRAVIQVAVGDHAVAGCQRSLIDAESVVLARDFNPPGIQIPNRLIGTAVAEGELPCGRSEGQCQQLMPKANSKYWQATNEAPQRLQHLLDGGRVAWAIGHHEAVWLPGQNLLRCGAQGQCGDLTPCGNEMSEDVPLCAAIEHNNPPPCGFWFLIPPPEAQSFVPIASLRRSDASGKVTAGHRRARSRSGNQCLIGDGTVRGHGSTKGAR